jgi:hypothetical protein
MSTNALSTLTSLPTSNVSPKDLSTQYASTNFTKRLQLVTKGKLVDKGLVKPGHWAIPISDDEAIDLGPEADILVLAVRHKTLDTNEKPPVASYDPDSELFKSIVAHAAEKDSGCMYGPSFLVYERSTNQFLEVFFGNASGRQEAGNLVPYLPVSEEQAKQFGSKFKAQGPQAATLKAKYIERPRYAWHAPVVGKCSTPFNEIPTLEETVKQITKFLEQKEDGPEVEEPAKASRKR